MSVLQEIERHPKSDGLATRLEPEARPDEHAAVMLDHQIIVFVVPGLAPGAYRIRAARQGFRPLTREGIRAQAEYDARRVARRPALPRKLIASGLTGLGLVLGGMIAQPGLVYPILFGLLGAALHFGAFGADPLADKGMEGMDQFQTDRVARAVTEAEAHLAGMKDAILRAGDRSLEARVEKFAAAARVLFRSVESDPGDLTAARKYLSVYLMGARDATVKFADIYAQSRDPKPRADYESLLTDQRIIRLIHGYGTGQLKRALTGFLQQHPLVARFATAPPEQGGGGVTVVELKE